MWARGGSNGKEESASEDERMTPYPKYTTTVIGAHSVPDWYEVLRAIASEPNMHPIRRRFNLNAVGSYLAA
jgi:hypothetical protein